MSSWKVILMVAVLMLVVSEPGPAQADMYYVPDDFSTIQAALDIATAGDEIVVRDGVYTGDGNKNLSFKGKAIILRSENGPTGCIIDCQYEGRAFVLNSGETADSVISGFTIMHGNESVGAGIICYNSSSPTISNCTITGCMAVEGAGIHCGSLSSPVIIGCTLSENASLLYGGAVFLSNSSPTISGCEIVENSSNYGGGIFCDASPLSIIEDSHITGNTSTTAGGGIYSSNSLLTLSKCVLSRNAAVYEGGGLCSSSASLEMTGCDISENWAVNCGGGMYIIDSSASVTNCIIKDNVVNSYGGGICCRNSSPIITHCSIGENMALMGGGIYFYADYSLPPSTITNSIFWNDDATFGPEMAVRYGAAASVDYSDVEGGEATAYVDGGGALVWGENNIDAAPLFIGPDDFHLSWGSPCIDSATDAGIYDDVDGDNRPHGFGFDMGADEFLLVSLHLVPDAVVIPPMGTLGYTATAVNNTGEPQAVVYWTNVTLPDGTIYPPTGAFYGVIVMLEPFSGYTRHLTHAVPNRSPVGNYTYNAYVGANPMMDEDHFDFEVSP